MFVDAILDPNCWRSENTALFPDSQFAQRLQDDNIRNRPHGMARQLGGRKRMFATTAVLLALAFGWSTETDVSAIAMEIAAEASKPSTGEGGHPLPLAAHWNVGTNPDGFSPDWQLQQIEAGHHLMPWFAIPWPKPVRTPPNYYAPLKRCARLHLPIAFVGTQWEKLLSEEKEFFELPPGKNPNVVDKNGKQIRQLSPFGPTKLWQEMGRRWGASKQLVEFQNTYPDPPRLVFISNNEAQKQKWRNLEGTKPYSDLYPGKHDDAFKRKILSDGWVERYKALIDGFRDALENSKWKSDAVFIGYNAFGPKFFGQHDAWMNYSEYTPGRLSPWPAAWDGASSPYYTNNWEASADCLVFSPQIQCMNWTFMLDEIYQVKPDFWFELAVWDGASPGAKDDKRNWYTSRNQTYTPQRYAGMVQFGMWMLRPRVVREFRTSRETRSAYGDYFDAVMESVDRIYKSDILKEFWRKGEMVENPVGGHPYRTKIPAEYRSAKRWYLLDTDVTPRRPWRDDTEMPVFALAFLLGDKPKRQYLLYAHAPKGNRQGIEITVPGYRKVVVDVSQGGTFHRIDEANGSIDIIK